MRFGIRRIVVDFVGSVYFGSTARLGGAAWTSNARASSCLRVSEVEDVRVAVNPHMDMRHDERDGFATFELSLPPRATRELVSKYRIEASRT